MQGYKFFIAVMLCESMDYEREYDYGFHDYIRYFLEKKRNTVSRKVGEGR